MAAKKTTKKTTKKAAVKKTSAKSTKTVAVSAVTDGVVTMKSIDDPGEATEGKPMKMVPTVDKETGVLTMVPSEDDE